MGAAKKRKKRKPKSNKKFTEDDKVRMCYLELGSLYDQEALEKKMKLVNATTRNVSASRSKILDGDVDNDNGEHSGTDYVSDDDDEGEYNFIADEDENADDQSIDPFQSPTHAWIIDTDNMEAHLQDVAACVACGGKLCIVEERSHRAGLATKMHFLCRNQECSKQSGGFFTSKKTGQAFDINTKSVLGGRLAGKGRSGLDKLTAVLGLSAPVVKQSFAEKSDLLRTKADKLLDENLKAAGKRARKFVNDSEGTIDVACSFDGAWHTRGWDSRKGIQTPIAENTGQVIDIVIKHL